MKPIIFTFFSVLLTVSGHAGEESGKPNIVVIYTDDQGYGDMGALNPETKFPTPNMDRIAREGLLFTDAHSADTVCTPSRYALLTGRYAWRTSLKRGVLGADVPSLIGDGRTTVASLLAENGYETAMFGKWHLGMDIPGTPGKRDWTKPITGGPNDHGFGEFFGIPASMNYGILTFLENRHVTEAPTLWTRKKPDAEHDTFRFIPPYDAKRKGKNDIEVAPSFRDDICLKVCTKKAVDYIGRRAEMENPFFIYIPMNSPHLPHSTAPEFVGRSKVGAYGDFMMETDHRIGEVLEALERRGLAHNTLVFFSSDNGAENGYTERLEKYGHASNGALKGGKRDIYEGGHRVPFAMRWPAVIKPGRICGEQVGQIDLLATCAEILGVRLPPDAGEDSYSLLAAMRGDDHPRPLRGEQIHHSSSGHFAIRERRWKLNLFRGSGGSLKPSMVEAEPGEPRFELYDLENDPGEKKNVVAAYPEVVARLTSRAAEIVHNGRSTPGDPRYNDGPPHWPQLTWIPEPDAAK